MMKFGNASQFLREQQITRDAQARLMDLLSTRIVISESEVPQALDLSESDAAALLRQLTAANLIEVVVPKDPKRGSGRLIKRHVA